MIALIDADIVAYRCAASAENEPEEIAILRVENLMREILEATNSESYQCFISPSKNFRHIIYPEYKANRRNTVDPKWRQACKDYLYTQWNGKDFFNYEADDALAWNQTDGTVICSIDKDLKQIAGWHYNFVKKEGDEVEPLQGLSTFYQQVLIGDKTDNLIGLKGIGPKIAARYLEGCYTEQEMFDTCNTLYQDKHQLAVNLMCMWLCRSQGETWVHHQRDTQLIIPSMLEQELDLMLESMKSSTKIT